MATKKSIGRTIAHIDVAADTSVRIHKDFFNSHSDYHQQSHSEIRGDKRISQHLSGQAPKRCRLTQIDQISGPNIRYVPQTGLLNRDNFRIARHPPNIGGKRPE
jgi:hypothetical protein